MVEVITLYEWEAMVEDTAMLVKTWWNYEDTALVRVYKKWDNSKTPVWAYEARYIKYGSDIYITNVIWDGLE